MWTRATNRKWWRPAATATGALMPVLVLAVGGCSSLQWERTISLPDLPKNAEANSLAVREHQRVLSAYGGAYDDPKLQVRLAAIVDQLARASGRSDLHYKVTILNSPAVNAFALPSGQLYVTRGLLALANDSAEVAWMMSHEMAHVIAGHAVQRREETARRTEEAGNAGSDPEAGPQGAAMALARSKIVLASFSLSQETEADTIGVGLAGKAGFDPMGAARLLNSMGRNATLRSVGRDTHLLDFVSSHPATPQRVANVQSAARNLHLTGPKIRDGSEYLQSLEGLKYGDDTDEGFVRGRQFIHPKLGFTFMAPEGFILDNSAEAVRGMKESAGLALRLDVVKVPPDQSLVEYLNAGWIQNIEDGSVEELVINGLPAATATASPAATANASGDSWSFRLYVIKLGGDVYRFIFAAKNRTDEVEKSFRDSIQTFRRLSDREKASRPLRLHIVRVQPGDTADSIAAGMIFADHQVDRFLVLNGLEAGAKLRPGDYVKVVIE